MTAARPESDLTRIRRKQKRGEDLTAGEQEALRVYYARYYRRKVCVHLKGDREKQYRELAAARNLSLSAFMQEQVNISLLPNAREQQLVAENQKLRDENAAMRGSMGALAVENSRLQARIESYEGVLLESHEQITRLGEG